MYHRYLKRLTNYFPVIRILPCFFLFLFLSAEAWSQTWYSFELKVSIGGVEATTSVLFNSRMTTGLDVTYDAGLLRGGKGVEIYTRLVDDNGVDFAVQCLPSDFVTLTIPVGIESNKTGVLTITDVLNDIPGNVEVTFEDKTEGTLTELDGEMDLDINVTAGLAGIGRFYLYVTNTDYENVSDTTITADDWACFDAIKTLTVAGSSSVVVEADGSADFISTQNIVFLPGFIAEEGSNMRAYITTQENFCSPTVKSEYISHDFYIVRNDLRESRDNKIVSYYSNGNIFIKGKTNGAKLLLSDINGRTIGRYSLSEDDLNIIPLRSIKPGIYIVKVLESGRQFTSKVVVEH
jgi:hypothetical protein